QRPWRDSLRRLQIRYPSWILSENNPMREIDYDSRDIVPRRRWQADLIDVDHPPRPGEWYIPEILREDATEIERLRAFVQGIAEQVCNYGNGLQNDECFEKSGRRCQPCEARHLLHTS